MAGIDTATAVDETERFLAAWNRDIAQHLGSVISHAGIDRDAPTLTTTHLQALLDAIAGTTTGQLLAHLEQAGRRNLRLCTELEASRRRIDELQLTLQALGRHTDTTGARHTQTAEPTP